MYRERQAAGAILWERRASVPTMQEQRILPDGCMDLIWADGALMVAGPDTTAFVTVDTVATYAGLRFAPGRGPAVFGVAASELRNQRVPLADVWGSAAARRLTDAISGDPLAGLEKVALSHAREADDPAIEEIVARLEGGETVAETASAVGFGERRLHRRCLDAFGYGPKTLARILRLNRAMKLVWRGVPFATVAAEAGYADQAHLARDVKSLAGVPLTVLVA